MIYQARISFQTAMLLEDIRQYFQLKSGGFISKGDALNQAYITSQWTTKYDFDEVWNAIHNLPVPDIKNSNLDLPENSNLIKVNISPETNKFLDNLKNKLPATLNAHYVTRGVVIRELLKSAYIAINQDYQSIFIKRNNFQYGSVSPTIIANTNSDLKMLINETRTEINRILDTLESRLDELSKK